MDNMLKNKFDLIVSLGKDCACTSYLRKCGLQYNSYPFDWLTYAPFANRIKLVVEDFKDFLNLEDLKMMQKPTEFGSDPNNDYYENISNQLYFWHDFPTGIPLEESYPEVNAKYQRRIKRLYEKIEQAQKILFVWFAHNSLQKIDDIRDAYKKLKEKFEDKEVYLLVIENCQKEEFAELENNHVLVIHTDTMSCIKKQHFNPTLGNKVKNRKLFRKIKIKRTFFDKIKRILYIICKIAISLVPNSNIRTRANERVQMFFYHAKL